MWLEAFVGLVTLCLVLYLWYVSDNGYWRKQGVHYLKPDFPFGNVEDIFLMKKTMGEVFRDIYRKFGPGDGAIGYFGFCWPALMLRDTELVKTVLVKEFTRFHDNGFLVTPSTDPLFGVNPFVTRGNRWKTIRAIHTPAHTVSRLKSMIPDMIPPCKSMIHYLRLHGGNVEVKEVCCYYTMDVVGACGFGMTSNSFLGSDHGFRKGLSGQIFANQLKPNLASMFAVFAPSVNIVFNLRILSKDLENFFVNMIEEITEHRKKNGTRRNDLVQMLIDDGGYDSLEMAGHAMTLFLDGNETSSVGMSWALYELASHPQVQQALRQEIFEAGIESVANLTYDKIQGLSYLDMVMNESLRLHPPVQLLSRVANEDCTLTSTRGQEYKLKKGMLVTIPVLALHTDPAHHRDPLKFTPERFSTEARKTMDKFSFLPFGEGPRICLGFKLALNVIKLGIIGVLTEFEIRLSPVMLNRDMELDPMSTFLHTAKKGLWLQFVPLQKNRHK